MTIRSQMQDIISTPDPELPEAPAGEEFISVSPATRKIAGAYERFRNTLEPDEEDILRRRAIERILERRLEEDKPADAAAEQILQELIRANYIEPVPRSYIDWLANIFEVTRQVSSRLDLDMAKWFLGLVAVHLDRAFHPRLQIEKFVQLMYQDTSIRAQWMDDMVAEEDRPTQMYIACHRALFEAEDYEIAYHYFITHFPNWLSHSNENINELTSGLPDFYARIQASLTHPSRDRLARILRPIAVPYRIIRDVVSEDSEKLSDPENIEPAIREAMQKRKKDMRSSMSRRAWNSILFLFFTKTLIAGVIEVPYEFFGLGVIHWPALAVNIGFHPLLLLFFTLTVRLPGEANTAAVAEHARLIITGETELPTIIIRATRHYGALTWAVFSIFYSVLFVAAFWGLFLALSALEFSLIAMFIFVAFLGLVSFLAIRIRRSVSDLRLLAKPESALGIVVTFLSLPILEFGRWLSQNIRELNVFLFFMDRVLEAPFKILIDITEEWFTFVRERKEEIV